MRLSLLLSLSILFLSLQQQQQAAAAAAASPSATSSLLKRNYRAAPPSDAFLNTQPRPARDDDDWLLSDSDSDSSSSDLWRSDNDSLFDDAVSGEVKNGSDDFDDRLVSPLLDAAPAHFGGAGRHASSPPPPPPPPPVAKGTWWDQITQPRRPPKISSSATSDLAMKKAADPAFFADANADGFNPVVDPMGRSVDRYDHHQRPAAAAEADEDEEPVARSSSKEASVVRDDWGIAGASAGKGGAIGKSRVLMMKASDPSEFAVAGKDGFEPLVDPMGRSVERYAAAPSSSSSSSSDRSFSALKGAVQPMSTGDDDEEDDVDGGSGGSGMARLFKQKDVVPSPETKDVDAWTRALLALASPLDLSSFKKNNGAAASEKMRVEPAAASPQGEGSGGSSSGGLGAGAYVTIGLVAGFAIFGGAVGGYLWYTRTRTQKTIEIHHATEDDLDSGVYRPNPMVQQPMPPPSSSSSTV
ncbi:hypothetical protein HDU67_010022, partial [Dinochytrium kinnereticum]